MSKRYYSESVLGAQPSVGASETNAAVSSPFTISHSGSLNLLVSLNCSSVTVGAGITAKLQSSSLDGEWLDGNSVSITSTGAFYIRMNVQVSADQAKLPLGDVGRVVITTGAGSSITLSDVRITQGR